MGLDRGLVHSFTCIGKLDLFNFAVRLNPRIPAVLAISHANEYDEEHRACDERDHVSTRYPLVKAFQDDMVFL